MTIFVSSCRRALQVGLTGLAIWGWFTFADIHVLAQNKQEARVGKVRLSNYAALLEVPEKARQRRDPFEGDAGAVAVGGKLFERHCAECHGGSAQGTRKGPTLLGNEVKQAAPGSLFWILTNGVVRKGMPVWSKLPEQQRWQLVTFLKSLESQSEGAQSKPNQ